MSVSLDHPLLGNRFRLSLRLRCVRECERSCVDARCFRCDWTWPSVICPRGRACLSSGNSRFNPFRAKTTPRILLLILLTVANSRISILNVFSLFSVASRVYQLLPIICHADPRCQFLLI